MASDTSSRVDRRRRTPSLAAFARVLRASAQPPIPLLVVRLPELERVAWRRGLRAARALERRALGAFATAAAGVLRRDDALAHDPGSDVFAAALLAPTRDGGTVDARSALARIAAALESSTRLPVVTGWTVYDRATDADALDDVVERALQRGEQERQRYAFFSALGHELRTPLSSIRGYLETLLDEDAVEVATRRRFVRIAYDESLRMSRLIEGMFEISLLDMQAAFPPLTSCNVAEVVASAAGACARTATARRVSIAIACPGDLRAAIDGDRLTLVLVNLIDNAVKHGRTGGHACITATAHEDAITIAVDDDGPGIVPAEAERIFALGQRGATAAAGTGIGLAVVRLIVERAGGRVVASASAMGGARFVVRVGRES